jgi:hypothetical protein
MVAQSTSPATEARASHWHPPGTLHDDSLRIVVRGEEKEDRLATWASHAFLRCSNMALQAASASAKVSKGEPAILTAPVF